MYTLRTVYQDGNFEDLLLGESYRYYSALHSKSFDKAFNELVSQEYLELMDASKDDVSGIVLWGDTESSRVLFTCNQHYIVMPNGQTLTMLK